MRSLPRSQLRWMGCRSSVTGSSVASSAMCNAVLTIRSRRKARADGIGIGRPSSVAASVRRARPMPFWACAQLQPQRERLAQHCLTLNGYETYLPRLREVRHSHGRKLEARPPLFPGYCFVAITLQWHAARWTAGVVRLVMDGAAPARVPDAVIDEIRSRECGGLIALPKPALARPAMGHQRRIGTLSPLTGCPLCSKSGQANARLGMSA